VATKEILKSLNIKNHWILKTVKIPKINVKCFFSSFIISKSLDTGEKFKKQENVVKKVQILSI
jgi:hypothetical protein